MSFHTDEALLRYEHVDVSFEGCAVLHDISISLGRGEILAVVGESGCGKSTLLRAAVKLLGASGLITRGHIWFEGKDLPALSERALRPIRGASVGMIFQMPPPRSRQFARWENKCLKRLPLMNALQNGKSANVHSIFSERCILKRRNGFGKVILLSFPAVCVSV